LNALYLVLTEKNTIVFYAVNPAIYRHSIRCIKSNV
jgi:hypothetical protein